MKSKLYSLLICYFFFKGNMSAQTVELTNKSPITPEASYIGDIVRNFSGGIKKGTSYLGLANLKLSLNTEESGLWKGGQVFINAANAHGGNPTADLIGDFHTVSNIEADEITYIHELWYKQTISDFEIIVGLQDLNTDFVSSEYGGLFINSTFGTPSTIADNVPSPIFPFTTIGISFKWKISENNTWKIALFDGLPTELEHNPHNLSWKFNKNDGAFVVTEYQYNPLIRKRLPGSFRTGFYYHSQLVEVVDNNIDMKVFNNNYGFYIIADQMIFLKPDRKGGLGIFAQLAISPRAINTHYRYAGLGLSWQGLINRRDEDKLGIAVTNAGFYDPSKKDETIIEICYKTILTDNIFIQPDFQYVINPGGTDQNLKNAIVGFLRFGINF